MAAEEAGVVLVVGRISRKATKPPTCSTHSQRCRSLRSARDHPPTTDESGQPTSVQLSKPGRPTRAILDASTRNLLTPSQRRVPRIMASSGRVLMRIR
jgi:hypothetical protein